MIAECLKEGKGRDLRSEKNQRTKIKEIKKHDSLPTITKERRKKNWESERNNHKTQRVREKGKKRKKKCKQDKRNRI